jgi:RecA-family ATPase
VRPGIDLVMLDPLIKTHGLEENSNDNMDFVCELLTKLAIEFNIAVDASQHTRKGILTAGDPDNARGARATRDAGRLGYTLTIMTEGEAETFGIELSQRKLYVRLDSAKVNIEPPAEKATWFSWSAPGSAMAMRRIPMAMKSRPSSAGRRRTPGRTCRRRHSMPR